jgi:heat shock protein HslJ
MKRFLVTIILIAVVFAGISCSKSSNSSNLQTAIIGKWSMTAQRANEGWVPPDNPVTYEFKEDGTFVRTDANGETQGTYTISNGQITLNSNGSSVTFDANINGNELQLNNADTGFKFIKVQ